MGGLIKRAPIGDCEKWTWLTTPQLQSLSAQSADKNLDSVCLSGGTMSTEISENFLSSDAGHATWHTYHVDPLTNTLEHTTPNRTELTE